MKPRKTSKASKPAVKPLTVRNYSWGCLYEGTKQQFLRAGLKASHFKHKPEEQFFLDHGEVARFAGDDSEQRPGEYRLYVEYSVLDRDVTPRINAAIKAMGEAFADMVNAVRAIKPRPLSETTGLRAVRDDE